MRKTMNLLSFFLFAFTALTLTSCEEDGGAPVITLNGNKNMTAYKGTPFVDPGATAIDDKDGDISSKIVVTGTVKDSLGNYTLNYSATDLAGNFSSKNRYVFVRYGNTGLAGTYSVVETASSIGGTDSYGATIVADNNDDVTIVFGSLTAQSPLTVTGAINPVASTGALESSIQVTQGGPITNFSASITETGGVLKINMSYVRPFNGTTTNCTAVWTKQ